MVDINIVKKKKKKITIKKRKNAYFSLLLQEPKENKIRIIGNKSNNNKHLSFCRNIKRQKRIITNPKLA